MLNMFLSANDTPPVDLPSFNFDFRITPEKITNFFQVAVDIAIGMLIAFIIIWLYRFVWKRWWKHKPATIAQRFIYNIILIVIYIVTILNAVLKIPNAEKYISPIIQSSGFLALGLGLAAQESLGNIINGMMLSVAKPFNVGDRVHLVNSNITGYVEDITLRHTILRTFVNSRIIIPNTSINKELIENSNFQQGRASSFIDVTITYDSDMDAAIDIMGDIIGNHDAYLDVRSDEEKLTQPKVKVFVRDLGINGVGLRASMWTHSTDNNFEASSDVRAEIKRRFDSAGVLISQIPARPENSLAGKPIEVSSALDYLENPQTRND